MRGLLWLVLIVTVSGCAAPARKMDLSSFEAASPRSILIVPAVNKSLDVDAPNYLLAALPVPLAEKGYYVFPVNTTKIVLEQEGFYEGEQVHQQPPAVLAKLFDADAVLFVTINRWDAQYAIIATTVTVEFEYRMTNRQGATIWSAKSAMRYSPQSTNTGSALGNLIAAAVSAAITRAAPNYMPLTRQANLNVFHMPPTAIPDGPYRNRAK